MDFDGTKETYPILSLFCDTEEEIELYPNPSKGKLFLKVSNSQEERIQVLIINPLGKMVRNENRMLIEGFNLIELDISDLVSGTYMILIVSDVNPITMRRFVKVD